jgi:hypothetical protein
MSFPKPEIQTNAGNYRYEWADWGLLVILDRLSQDGRNDLVAEVRIIQKAPGHSELLEHTKLNLMSMTTRSSLVKKLVARNGEIDWDNIITCICHLTLEDYRKGEPLVLLGAEPPRMDVEWLLYPILQLNEPTTIFAPGEAGKTWLADYISVLVQHAQSGIGVGALQWSAWKPGNVLYLDWETSWETHARRIWAIKRGMGITDNKPDDMIRYRFGTQPLAADITEIQRLVIENKIVLVIVDSQMAASGAEPEKADSANAYYNALRSLRVTTLTLDHVTGASMDSSVGKAPRPFGSIAKYNRSRAQWELKKQQDEDCDFIEWGLYHRKFNDGRKLKPIGIRAEFHYSDDAKTKLDQVIFDNANIKDNPILLEGAAAPDRIYDLLLHGEPKTQSEIAVALRIPDATVRSALNRGKDFRFTKLASDKWGARYGE